MSRRKTACSAPRPADNSRPAPRPAPRPQAAARPVLLLPAVAVPVLALVSNYRLGAALNMLFSAATLAAGISLLFDERTRSDLIVVDDFNIYLVTLTTFVGFTTSVFSASYIAHELEIGRLTPVYLRFYHALYQAMMAAMNTALVANNVGLMWV